MNWTEIFAFGTVWFWILTAAAIIAIVAFVENDEEQNGTGATITLGIFLAGLIFLGNSEFFRGILHFIVNNPGMIIGMFVGYLALGVVWSFVKWYLFLNKKVAYANEHELTLKDSEISYKNNKSRIITWMSYWPFSAAWTAINNPVKKAFEFLSEKLSGGYQKMSDSMLKNVKANMNKTK